MKKEDTASTFRNQFTKETEEVIVSKTQTYKIKILKPLFNGKVCLSDKFDVCQVAKNVEHVMKCSKYNVEYNERL